MPQGSPWGSRCWGGGDEGTCSASSWWWRKVDLQTPANEWGVGVWCVCVFGVGGLGRLTAAAGNAPLWFFSPRMWPYQNRFAGLARVTMTVSPGEYKRRRQTG